MCGGKGETPVPRQGTGKSAIRALVFVTIIGVAFLASAVWAAHYQYTVLKTWPTAEATVARSEVVSFRDSKGTRMYRVELGLRYAVNRKEYLTPVPSDISSSSHQKMRRRAEEYAPGTRLPIRFNPADPNDIRLNVGYNVGFFALPLIFTGVGLVVSAAGVLLLKKVRPRPCPSCGGQVELGSKYGPHCAAKIDAGRPVSAS